MPRDLFGSIVQRVAEHEHYLVQIMDCCKVTAAVTFVNVYGGIDLTATCVDAWLQSAPEGLRCGANDVVGRVNA